MAKRHRIVAGLFLLVGIANLVRGSLAFPVASVVEGWELSLSLTWLGVFYLVWGVVLAGLGIALWRKRWTRRRLKITLPIAVGYQGSLWIIRLLFYRASYAKSLWGRDLLLTLLFLALVAERTGAFDSILKRKPQPPKA
ncbi:MAG: hypothetical protein JXB35_12170 [Anaerolineae bacterium]|nr:hypothetical protein [Anaerolineae bacterium]